MKKISISIIAALILLTHTLLATNWELLETKYERIFYPATHKQMAIEVAYYIEKHRQNVLSLSGKEKPYPIYYVIQDTGMITNGYASLIDNKIGLFTPTPGSSLTEGFNYNWLETVSIHELFHNYHGHNAKGINTFFKYTIGKFNPHIFLPPMLIEGLAVYQESQLNPYQGRLNTGFYDAILLTKAKENTLASFTQANKMMRHFPTGQHYIYGGSFIQYLANTYSEQSLTTFLNEYSYKPGINPLLVFPPFGIDRVKTPYNKSFADLYQDYKDDLKEKSKNWILPTNPITRGSYISPPIIQENTIYVLKRINYYTKEYDSHTAYQLIAINKKTKKETVLKTFNSLYGHPIINPLAIKNNTLYIAFTTEKLGFSNNDLNGLGLTTDIYSYHLKTQIVKKELSDAITAFMLDSNQDLIYAKQLSGLHKTDIINHKTNSIIATHPLYITSIKATKNTIYLTAKHAEGSSNIYTTDSTFKTLSPIIATNYIETYPSLSGDWLYFTANYNKQFQIYRKQLTTHKLEKLSGPSFMTKGISNNNEITYISLDSKSMTLNQHPFQTTPVTLPDPEIIIKPNQTELYQSLDYKLYKRKHVWLKNLTTLPPIIRVPIITSIEKDNDKNIGIGLNIQGYDKLGYLNYSTSLLHVIDTKETLLYNLDISTSVIQPLTINYNQVLNTKTLSATTPIYLSSIRPLQYVDTGIATDFDDIMATTQIIYFKKNEKITLNANKSFNKENSYHISTNLIKYVKTSQVSLSIDHYYQKDITILKRNTVLPVDYSSITDTSLSLEYTKQLKPILKSIYKLNTSIENLYGKLFIDHIPFYSKDIILGAELLLETNNPARIFNPFLFSSLKLGVILEKNETPQLYVMFWPFGKE